MTLTIETAQSRQFPEIADLAKKIWNQHYLGIISQPQIDYMLAQYYNLEALQKDVDSGSTFITATLNKEMIGFAAFRSLTEDTLKLEKLYLCKHHHGQGYGSALLESVDQTATDRGAQAIILFVNKHNQGAIATYFRAGYTHFDSILEPIGEGFFVDDYILRKSLTTNHEPASDPLDDPRS